ncbi:hypothetical protein MXF29_11830 [Pseudomonas sp. NC26]|uniref:Uncharacterized protein n=2 Tax=Pseudomonas TaxID=286 RepID=A0A7W2QJ26_PSEPU|nr:MULTISPECIES: hypothetical protein [Pseudomonas]MBA6116442.1 hypothetical protein [Pseudomonas putida]MCZ9636787.1 hypothetical protein [Pseudomonas putida]MEC4876283.1 hypothetical protein [Pseudomonas sp. NC26]
MHTFSEKVSVVKWSQAPGKRDFAVIAHRVGAKPADSDCRSFMSAIDHKNFPALHFSSSAATLGYTGSGFRKTRPAWPFLRSRNDKAAIRQRSLRGAAGLPLCR